MGKPAPACKQVRPILQYTNVCFAELWPEALAIQAKVVLLGNKICITFLNYTEQLNTNGITDSKSHYIIHL